MILYGHNKQMFAGRLIVDLYTDNREENIWGELIRKQRL